MVEKFPHPPLTSSDTDSHLDRYGLGLPSFPEIYFYVWHDYTNHINTNSPQIRHQFCLSGQYRLTLTRIYFYMWHDYTNLAYSPLLVLKCWKLIVRIQIMVYVPKAAKCTCYLFCTQAYISLCLCLQKSIFFKVCATST